MAGLLAILAHPDDEFFCAGLLASASARGVPVHLAWWTRGEGGGSGRRRSVARFLPRAWHFRTIEARRSGKVLGAASVNFLDAIDPVPAGSRFFAPDEEQEITVGKIERLRARLDPELLISHGADGEYGHPAHRRLHEAAGHFLGQLPVVSFAATLPGAAPSPRYSNRSDPADYVLDARPFDRKKLAIIRAHASQKSAFETLVNPRHPSLDDVLQASCFEGYHVRNEEPLRSAALSLLERWSAESPGPV
jgi:LmbE family N-acetylglucosaminyl deacetylase